MDKPARDQVIEAEEALLDAIEIYTVGQADVLRQGSGHVGNEEAAFPPELVTRAHRLREIIYACEGLGADYLEGLERVAATQPDAPLSVRDEYMVAQEDLLGAIEDYSALLWGGAYPEITEKARALRVAVAEAEGLGPDYLRPPTMVVADDGTAAFFPGE